MEEHKVLTGMLLVALVVSVVGTVITVDRLGALGGVSGLTGAATTGDQYGNLTISEVVAIKTTGDIDFGTGEFDVGEDYQFMSSYAESTENDNSENTTFPSVESIPTNRTKVENQGNVGINVTVSSTKIYGTGGNSFLCAGDAGPCGLGHSDSDPEVDFAFIALDEGSDSCNETAQRTSFAETVPYQVCDCLTAETGLNSMHVYLEMGLTRDAAGQKTSTLTYTATKADGSGVCFVA